MTINLKNINYLINRVPDISKPGNEYCKSYIRGKSKCLHVVTASSDAVVLHAVDTTSFSTRSVINASRIIITKRHPAQ
jgi:hypothetical protein